MRAKDFIKEAGYPQDPNDLDWGSMDKRAFKRAELHYELGHEDELERQKRQYRANQKPVLQHYVFFDVPADKEADAKQIGMKQTKSGKWFVGVYNTSGKTTQDRIDTATLMFGTGKKWAPKNEGIDITTGKEQPKTVMGFNVKSKQDKINGKKSQIALAKRNAPKSGLTTKDVPRLEKELADLMNESIHLRHNLQPGTYKHREENITVIINSDSSVSFKQPAEWEIEGDGEYLEFVETQLADASNWTAVNNSVNEGGFFDPDKPNIGDMVKHRNGAKGKVKKIGTQGDETHVYFRDQNGEMNYGQWKKHVFPMNKKESVEEALTEEQFDEAAGEKDACYHKVKARYKVWPSAYASGALVQCRKVGAKNWGNKSKK